MFHNVSHVSHFLQSFTNFHKNFTKFHKVSQSFTKFHKICINYFHKVSQSFTKFHKVSQINMDVFYDFDENEILNTDLISLSSFKIKKTYACPYCEKLTKSSKERINTHIETDHRGMDKLHVNSYKKRTVDETALVPYNKHNRSSYELDAIDVDENDAKFDELMETLKKNLTSISNMGITDETIIKKLQIQKIEDFKQLSRQQIHH